ncbi:paired amphipathic helix protein Sin3-like 3 [Trifolium pratense]|uniref:paired amphipathic helix protein Sin3-like 3 n=1 Tax=Trifolium pratense TaxID=57577 RepID=UPI001E692685|nr:paired amphipathic helix protein Sin3-like 3 [Trifolium pratense]
MKKILEDDKDLILKLNRLVPDRYKINDITSPKKRPNLEDAKIFLRKIRAQFQGVDDHIYKSLIFILNMFYRKVKSFNEVHQEVTTLLKDHPDLLDEFTHFLPEGIASQKILCVEANSG